MLTGSIFYLSTAFVPSSTANGLQVMKMCQAFRQEEYDIRLVAPIQAGRKADAVEYIQKQYGLSTVFSLTTIPAWAEGRGIRYDIQAIKNAKKGEAALVYTRSLRCAVLAALFGLRVVVEMHDVPGGRWGPRYMRFILSSRRTAAIVVITEALRKELAVRFGDLRTCPVIVAPDGVDLDRFTSQILPSDARRSLGLDPVGFTAGYAGSLYAGRGVELVLNLARRFPEGRFLIIGGPTDRAKELERGSRDLKLNNVLFPGFIPNAEIPSFLAACDVLLMPYQKSVSVSGGGDTANWMSPMKMFEYLASGRLILSSDLPVLREVLNDGNAVLCPPGDVDAWEGALRKAEADSAWRSRLGQRAREDAKRYDWRERVKRIMKTVGN